MGKEWLSPIYKYEWKSSVTKHGEGGMGTSTAVRVLKGRGVRFGVYPSPYVGQTVLWIQTNTIKEMKRAFKILKNYGYVDNISEEIRDNVERVR